MYQACDHLFKISEALPRDHPWNAIAGMEHVTWQALLDAVKIFSQVEPCKVEYSTECVLRTIFPTTLKIFIENLDGIHLPRILLLDHIYAWAWYWAMYRALAEAMLAWPR